MLEFFRSMFDKDPSTFIVALIIVCVTAVAIVRHIADAFRRAK